MTTPSGNFVHALMAMRSELAKVAEAQAEPGGEVFSPRTPIPPARHVSGRERKLADLDDLVKVSFLTARGMRKLAIAGTVAKGGLKLIRGGLAAGAKAAPKVVRRARPVRGSIPRNPATRGATKIQKITDDMILPPAQPPRAPAAAFVRRKPPAVPQAQQAAPRRPASVMENMNIPQVQAPALPKPLPSASPLAAVQPMAAAPLPQQAYSRAPLFSRNKLKPGVQPEVAAPGSNWAPVPKGGAAPPIPQAAAAGKQPATIELASSKAPVETASKAKVPAKSKTRVEVVKEDKPKSLMRQLALPALVAGTGYGLYKGIPAAVNIAEQAASMPRAYGGGLQQYQYGYTPGGQAQF